MGSSDFGDVRALVSESGEDSKIEVNQRALIDKILARYATPGAVYRELLQNSNDANATRCEVRITTLLKGSQKVVGEVVYRNNGMPFRPQDWNRLKKIAEGNPDSSKVGFFGVGAYAMFSICEEPMVVSGDEALVFKWKGDSLWARVGKSNQEATEWTSFVLPARDPYPTPDLVEFGSFLFGNLTFLNSIKSVAVFIDGKEELLVERSILTAPKTVRPPKSTSWWINNGAVLQSPSGYFRLKDSDGSITETRIGLKAKLGTETAEAQARLMSAVASVNVPKEMKKRIERVTKKNPPENVALQIVIGNSGSDTKGSETKSNEYGKAKTIVDSFSPGMGNGKIFIGFKTSQSTGLGVHYSAPLIPTVEREAIDLVDPTLKIYNSELLFAGGILMRLGLEHVMLSIDKMWENESSDRKKFDDDREAFKAKKTLDEEGKDNSPSRKSSDSNQQRTLFGFARFMGSGLRRIADIATVSETYDGDRMLHPKDERPLSRSETSATILMRCFSPEQSTPEYRIGQFLASGFESAMPNANSPVLTQSGVMRGNEAFLPNFGMEAFMKDSVVRSTVLNNAKAYLEHVARVPKISLNNLSKALRSKVLSENELVCFFKWWLAYSKKYIHPSQMNELSQLLKNSIKFTVYDTAAQKEGSNIYSMKTFTHFTSEKYIPLTLPLPSSVLPLRILQETSSHVFEDASMKFWFQPLTFLEWIQFIAKHPCMNDFISNEELNLSCLQFMHSEFLKYKGENIARITQWMRVLFSDIPCLPYDDADPTHLITPKDLYLPSAEIEVFSGVELHKVSKKLLQNGISEKLLKSMSVRETVSMEILFTQLDGLKWNENPLPLIRFLRQSKLKENDLQKLKMNRYLPAAGIKDQLFAPADLCLPQKRLLELGFVRVLQWPEENDASEHTPDGKFLVLLGCKVAPSLEVIIRKLSIISQESDREFRDKILDFLSENTTRSGIYGSDLGKMSKFSKVPFLPTTKFKDVLSRDLELFSQSTIQDCFYSEEPKILGFKIVEARHQTVAQRLGVSDHPNWESLYENVLFYASEIKNTSRTRSQEIIQYFQKVYEYLSTRCSRMPAEVRLKLRNDPIIAVKQSNGNVVFRTSHQVFFKTITSGHENENSRTLTDLFDFVPESTFLRYIGVKDEPGPEEICRLIAKDPQSVFDKCGQLSYKGLLKRVSANFKQISSNALNDLKMSKCLLALRFIEENDLNDQIHNSVDDRSQNMIASLEKPELICVIDDASMQRMFNPPTCPIESDLEELYLFLGSKYISQVVSKYHETSGILRKDTSSTKILKKTLEERIPLLIAPNVTHRPLLPNTTSILHPNNIEIFEVDKIFAIFVLGNKRKTHDVTCCSQKTLKVKTSSVSRAITLIIRSDIDYFDVGSTICDLILTRSHLEDKFLFGTLLEAPLSQLRNRGFPVDRIIKVKEETYKKTTNQTDLNISDESKNMMKNSLKQKEKTDEEGFLEILSNKFPDCNPEHIKRLLANDKSSNKLLNVSRILEKGSYPTRDGTLSRPVSRSSISRQSGSKHNRPLTKMREAFSRIGTSSTNETQRTANKKIETSSRIQNEEENRKNLENLLKTSINSTSLVAANGVNTPSRSRKIEKGEDHEHIEGKNLVPAPGPNGNNRTSNGLMVFASRLDPGSLDFVRESTNWRYIEKFSVLLHQLSQIFSIDSSSVAVYYDISGSSIAFNLGGALYFNARYFVKLHCKTENNLDSGTYSYWFVVFCHELAHNLIKSHGKEHGQYTEAFCQQYQSKLFQLLKELQL